jgi:hypothetical protein
MSKQRYKKTKKTTCTEREQRYLERKEILWNIINSGLAGFLVLLGAMTTGNIDIQSLFIAGITALIVAVTQFKNYWQGEEKEYKFNKTYGFMKLM